MRNVAERGGRFCRAGGHSGSAATELLLCMYHPAGLTIPTVFAHFDFQSESVWIRHRI